MARTNRPRQQHFPWRDGHHVQLLHNGEAFYPAMLEAIGQAQHTILLESYLFESGAVADEFITALQDAAHRGVQVYTLIDDLGSSKLNDDDRQRLQAGNMRLAVYNPLQVLKVFANVYRNHRKQLTVDGQLTITGGMGISDEFDPRFHSTYWREEGLLIRGPVVQDWQTLFASSWAYANGQPLSLPPTANVKVSGSRGRLVTSQGGQALAIQGSVIHHVRHARNRAWLCTAYFMPTRKLRRVLREADRRGVDVRLLVPGPLTDHPSIRYAGYRYYGRLLRYGVRIFEYQPRFIHAKLVICDDWLSLGSANLDRWSSRWTLEANQEIDDAERVQEAATQYLHDLEQSSEITYADWRRRPLGQRLKEWYWGQIDQLVERLHHWLLLERLNPWRRKSR